MPADLRDVKGVEAALLAAGFNPQLPTYVLAECVLVYMEAEESSAVVRWLGSFLSTAACVVYEQVQSRRAGHHAGMPHGGCHIENIDGVSVFISVAW